MSRRCPPFTPDLSSGVCCPPSIWSKRLPRPHGWMRRLPAHKADRPAQRERVDGVATLRNRCQTALPTRAKYGRRSIRHGPASTHSKTRSGPGMRAPGPTDEAPGQPTLQPVLEGSHGGTLGPPFPSPLSHVDRQACRSSTVVRDRRGVLLRGEGVPAGFVPYAAVGDGRQLATAPALPLTRRSTLT